MAAELEWVQQGIYTEPNDQSVWLYHHWLTTLGRGCEQLRITHCAALGGELVVFFSQAVCAWAWGGTAPQPPPAVVTWDHTNPPHPQQSYSIDLLNSNCSEWAQCCV